MNAMLRGLAAVLLLGAGALAQAQPAAPALTRADAEAWLDGLLPFALRTQDFAGAVVVVVKDGEVLLAKGYGHADVAAGKPVDPATTLFRPGSVSKLFTWTAVMQLAEQDRVDLDADVNAYLDLRIPPREGRSVTLRQLLTHSAGFEEMGKHLFSRSVRTLPDLRSFIHEWIPTRVFAPGEIPAYSNYGASLAGYVVERISGMPFEDYVERHILQPLEMRHSTFRQPLPPELAPLMAQGYKRTSQPVAFELVGPAPAGALSAPGLDMANFMIAHLQEGRFRERQILQPGTARLMHATALQPLPPLNGMALGFYREDRNGEVIVSHAGDTRAFHSNLNLILSRNVGLFVSISGSGATATASSKLRRALFEGFLDRYFPAPLPEEPTLDSARAHGAQLVGRYRASRASQTNFLRALGLVNQFAVRQLEDGTLETSFHRDLADQPRRWREVAPYVWREVGGRHRLAAKVEDGKVLYVGSDDYPPIAVGLPVPAWASGAWNLPLLIFTVAVLALTVLLWPAEALVRRGLRVAPVAQPSARERRLARLAVGAAFLFFAGWVLVFTRLLLSPTALDGGLDPGMRLVQLVGLLTIPGALVAVRYAVLSLRAPLSRWRRFWSAAVALACVATVWFAFSLRLITPGLNY